MIWTVRWTPRAAKERDRLDARVRERVLDAVLRYADSGVGDAIRLKGRDDWRLKVGKWRVLFRPENETGTLWILHVLPRDKAYGVREPESEFGEDYDDEALTEEEWASIARGRADHAAGRVVSHEQVKREFGW